MKYNKLRQFCAEHNLVYSNVLKECNITGRTIMALAENTNISLSIIDRLCTYLHCQPSDIMELDSQYAKNINVNS